MLRVIRTDWREGLTPEEKAAIQAQNADPSQPLATWGYEYLVQVGIPPMVALVKMSDYRYQQTKRFVALAPTETLEYLQALAETYLLAKPYLIEKEPPCLTEERNCTTTPSPKSC